MEKLKLALEDLVVESFTPAAGPQEPGTVHAHESGPYTDECQSCGMQTDCGDPCDGGSYTCGCPTGTCYGYYTCPGAYTCGEVDTCRYPECTAPGAQC